MKVLLLGMTELRQELPSQVIISDHEHIPVHLASYDMHTRDGECHASTIHRFLIFIKHGSYLPA